MATQTAPTQPATPIRSDGRSTRAVYRFAWGVFGFMVLVVLWGAVVRATSSGAGCGANWPLCNGDFVPHHPRIATIIEFTHRSMSGICTFLVVSLAVWTFYATPRRHPARWAILWSAGFLVAEAFLGAVLVLRHDVLDNASFERVVMQAIHFTNTMALLAALAMTAWFLRGRRSAVAAAPGLRSLALLTLVATVLVGATGALAALADTLFPSTSVLEGLTTDFAVNAPVLIRMRWVHPAAMLIDLVCVGLLVRVLPTRHSFTVLGLLAMQAVLGVIDVLLLSPIWMQVLHLLAADIYWAALVCLAADVIWPAAVERLPDFTGQGA